ncbi:hypothetical protein GCM10023080_071870 [Streptomyces pseudoechinosporeus]
MLTAEDDPPISAGRIYLIERVVDGGAKLLPSMLPADKLTEFCQGFADILLEKVGQENTLFKRRLAALQSKTS